MSRTSPSRRRPLAGRGSPRSRSLLGLASSIAACAAAAAPADPAATTDRLTIPDENTPVIDPAGVIDPATRQQLIEWLHELREKTHAQVKVLTVPSLHGEDIFAFTERHYDLWKLGDKEKEKGALIVLALKEHKVRIHTGRGLEGALPDSWCGTISRQAAKQYFSHGQYSQGLAQLVQAVASRVAADEGVKLTGVSDQPLQLGNDCGRPRNDGVPRRFLYHDHRRDRHRPDATPPATTLGPPHLGLGTKQLSLHARRLRGFGDFGRRQFRRLELGRLGLRRRIRFRRRWQQRRRRRRSQLVRCWRTVASVGSDNIHR